MRLRAHRVRRPLDEARAQAPGHLPLRPGHRRSRRFVGLRLSGPLPDETTIPHFRHLLEQWQVAMKAPLRRREAALPGVGEERAAPRRAARVLQPPCRGALRRRPTRGRSARAARPGGEDGRRERRNLHFLARKHDPDGLSRLTHAPDDPYARKPSLFGHSQGPGGRRVVHSLVPRYADRMLRLRGLTKPAKLTIDLDRPTYRALNVLAQREDVSVSWTIHRAIKALLSQDRESGIGPTVGESQPRGETMTARETASR